MCSAHVPASEWLNGNSTERVGVGLVGVEGGDGVGVMVGIECPVFPQSPITTKSLLMKLKKSNLRSDILCEGGHGVTYL